MLGLECSKVLALGNAFSAEISEIDACCDHIRVAARGGILATWNRPA
jgi:hypothetical protein